MYRLAFVVHDDIHITRRILNRLRRINMEDTMKSVGTKMIRVASSAAFWLGLGAFAWGTPGAPIQKPSETGGKSSSTGSQAGQPAGSQEGQPAGSQTGQPAQTTPYTAEEYAAYQKIAPITDPKTKVEAIEDFVKKYPSSVLGPYVHQQALAPYQMLNQADKVIEHGEAIISGIKGEDPQAAGLAVQTLTTLAYVYAERQGSNPTYKAKAQQSAEKAVQQINAMQKPAQLSDAQWEEAKKQFLATNYSTLGLVYLAYGVESKDKEEKNKQLTKSTESTQKALEINKKDDLAWYRLGLAYTEQNKGEDAVKSLAKAVAINGPAKPYAQQTLEEVYKKLHKNSTEGLPDVIKKAGEELGAK